MSVLFNFRNEESAQLASKMMMTTVPMFPGNSSRAALCGEAGEG
jgi:hypothetical protein